ncbi:MAG: hypothetical protein AB8E82_13260 [Aureispira sp.]
MDPQNTTVQAHDVQLYYNTLSKNYSLEFYIKDYKKQTAPVDKVEHTTSYEAIGNQETLLPDIECVETPNHDLYFSITIDTNEKKISYDDTEYDVTIVIQGKQNNHGPRTYVKPSIKFSGTRDKDR